MREYKLFINGQWKESKLVREIKSPMTRPLSARSTSPRKSRSRRPWRRPTTPSGRQRISRAASGPLC